MGAATASRPNWTGPYSPRVDGTQRRGQDYIDISDAAGSYRLSRFRRLVTQWRAETYCLSSVTAKSEHPAFREIVGMGDWALPWILDELRRHRDFLLGIISKSAESGRTEDSCAKHNSGVDARYLFCIQGLTSHMCGRSPFLPSGRYGDGSRVQG